MFVLKPKPTFEQDVLIPVPGGDAAKITFVFNHKGIKELQAFYATLSVEGGELRKDPDALGELIAGWKAVDTPYSPEALEDLINDYPGSAKVIFDGYNKGLFEGKRKNS